MLALTLMLSVLSAEPWVAWKGPPGCVDARRLEAALQARGLKRTRGEAVVLETVGPSLRVALQRDGLVWATRSFAVNAGDCVAAETTAALLVATWWKLPSSQVSRPVVDAESAEKAALIKSGVVRSGTLTLDQHLADAGVAAAAHRENALDAGDGPLTQSELKVENPEFSRDAGERLSREAGDRSGAPDGGARPERTVVARPTPEEGTPTGLSDGGGAIGAALNASDRAAALTENSQRTPQASADVADAGDRAVPALSAPVAEKPQSVLKPVADGGEITATFRWSLSVRALGTVNDGVRSGGQLAAELGARNGFAGVLELGLEAPRSAAVSPGVIAVSPFFGSAGLGWEHRFARVHLAFAAAFRLYALSASATGFTQNTSALIWAPGAVGQAELRVPIFRGLFATATISAGARFRPERLSIQGVGESLTVPPWFGTGGLGLGWGSE